MICKSLAILATDKTSACTHYSPFWTFYCTKE